MKRYTDRYSIGLTGGIGCGKTTVTNHFASLGVCVIDADEVSRSLTAAGEPAVREIAQLFGEQVLESQNTLDRKQLRNLVFDNPEKKKQLEQLLHPLIRKKIQQLAKLAESSYIIFSIPLLIETNQTTLFDRIAVVDAPTELRIKWIKKRSNLTEVEINKVIASQASAEQRNKVADDIIDNYGTLEQLYRQVKSLHHQYLLFAEKSKSIT